MSFYRAFATKDIEALHRHVTLEKLETMRLTLPNKQIFYNYHNNKPVDKDTRFAPVGYPKRPLYITEDPETAIHEFSYWMLQNPDDLKSGVKFWIAIVDINNYQLGHDVNTFDITLQNKLLDKHSYVVSHQWVNDLLPDIPPSIRYPSVRNPNPGGTNIAVFQGTVDNPIKFLGRSYHMYLDTTTSTLVRDHSAPDKKYFPQF